MKKGYKKLRNNKKLFLILDVTPINRLVKGMFSIFFNTEFILKTLIINFLYRQN